MAPSKSKDITQSVDEWLGDHLQVQSACTTASEKKVGELVIGSLIACQMLQNSGLSEEQLHTVQFIESCTAQIVMEIL